MPKNLTHKMQRLSQLLGNVLLRQNNRFTSVEALPGLLSFIQERAPAACLVPTSLLDLFCNDVILACRALQIPSILLQSGWDNLSSKGIIYESPSYLGCWGPQSRRHALNIQNIPGSALFEIGAPHYDALKQATIKEIAHFKSNLNIKKNESLILFGGSFRQFDEISVLKQLEHAIENGLLGLVKIFYRPHPWRAARTHEDNFFNHAWKHVIFDPDMKTRYMHEQNQAGYIKKHTPMYDMSYLSLLLSASDGVISPMSTLLVEALILNKPTLAIAFGDGKHRHSPKMTSKMTHFQELRKSSALIWCTQEKFLLDQCKILLDSRLNERLKGNRESLLADIVIRFPNNYSERLVSFCKTVLTHFPESAEKQSPLTHLNPAIL